MTATVDHPISDSQPTWLVAEKSSVHHLADGTRVLVRPLLYSDRFDLAARYQQLSVQSRRLRFFSAPAELTETDLEYLTNLDYHDHFAWAAFDLDDFGQPGIGVARYIRDRERPASAEAAVTVMDAYQNRGLGTLLLAMLEQEARGNGISTFFSYVLWDNTSVLDGLREAGARVSPEEPGVARIEFDAPPEGPAIHPVVRRLATANLASPADSHTRRRRRRWPWIAGTAVLACVAAVASLLFVFGPDGARQVTVDQAQSRLGSAPTAGPIGARPAPGVYLFQGSGTDRLSLPPASQPEGPSIPGTVTLQGSDCWTLRLDYSTHHWQSWQYCRQGGELRQTGGQVWQLWPVGPMSVTNSTNVTCDAGSVALPARLSAGATWRWTCTGTSSAVKGRMTSVGTYRYLGPATVAVAGRSVVSEHFSITRTDTGAQRGVEGYQLWLDPRTGLPLRIDQSIRVTTSTPFGTSTYTQTGTATLTSLNPVSG